jgi:hypothetical protein
LESGSGSEANARLRIFIPKQSGNDRHEDASLRWQLRWWQLLSEDGSLAKRWDD